VQRPAEAARHARDAIAVAPHVGSAVETCATMPPPKKLAARSPRVRVEVLGGQRQVARLHFLAQASDGGYADHRAHAERLQRPDVGAEVDLAREVFVALAVARQECDGRAAEHADAHRRRRGAERRRDACIVRSSNASIP